MQYEQSQTALLGEWGNLVVRNDPGEAEALLEVVATVPLNSIDRGSLEGSSESIESSKVQ